MKKRLIPILMLAAALLLTAIAPAETIAPATACPGCGSTTELHDFCTLCDTYSCDPDYKYPEYHEPCEHCGRICCQLGFGSIRHEPCEGCGVWVCDEAHGSPTKHYPCKGCGLRSCTEEYRAGTHYLCIDCGAYTCEGDHPASCKLCFAAPCVPAYYNKKHSAACVQCGEAYCGPWSSKGHTACPCGAFSCDEDFVVAEHKKCICGIYACQDKYYSANHARCEGCGLTVCIPAYTHTSHAACSGCGMRKCDPAYDESAHRKCNGCRALLCASEADHSSCPHCQRYVCNFTHEYEKFEHKANWKGEYDCLGYPEPTPAPVLPPENACPGGCGAATPCAQYRCHSYTETGCELRTPIYKCKMAQGTLQYCSNCRTYQCIAHQCTNTSHQPTWSF